MRSKIIHLWHSGLTQLCKAAYTCTCVQAEQPFEVDLGSWAILTCIHALLPAVPKRTHKTHLPRPTSCTGLSNIHKVIAIDIWLFLRS